MNLPQYKYAITPLKACRFAAAGGLAPLCVAVVAPGPALASNGAYAHGDGIHSLGFGGVGLVAAQDSYAVAANPALLPSLHDRYDLGLDWQREVPGAEIRGNLLGSAQQFKSSFINVPMPQFGVTRELDERFSVGATGFAAGIGTSYHHSPYQRFGAESPSSVTFGLAGISNAIAWRPAADQTLALALNLSYQLAEIKGLTPFKLFSEQPDHVSDQGIDGAAGIGFTLGWHAYLADWLEVGAAYRSKTWAQRFHKYSGLLPDGGRLEFPAHFGGAIAVRPIPRLTIALEDQRVLYADESATGNLGVAEINQGQRLGAADGPGFGWKSQNIVRLGLEWQCSPQLSLRGGYSHGTRMLRPGETLLGILAPTTITDHFTAGASFSRRDGWQISAYAMLAPNVEMQGDHSIPIYLGGGEASVHNASHSLGISLGRRFD